jgi:NAD(P)H:quinone oxidoreductase type IV
MSASLRRPRRRESKLLAVRQISSSTSPDIHLTDTPLFNKPPTQQLPNKHHRIAETLPEDVLSKMHAPPKPDDVKTLSDPADILSYDAFLFGIPTRYGNLPGQWKAFWDKTGGQWQTGAFWGKYAGLFISTGTMGGGQESTAIATMSTLAHHGFIYVPLGYKTVFGLLADLSEVRGGSPWGAGTFSVSFFATPPLNHSA